MKHYLFAKDLYYFVEKSRYNFKIKFCACYGDKCFELPNREAKYSTSKNPVHPVWKEDRDDNYQLNFPEKVYRVYKDCDEDFTALLPSFLTQKEHSIFKIDLTKLNEFQKELNSKLAEQIMPESNRILLQNVFGNNAILVASKAKENQAMLGTGMN